MCYPVAANRKLPIVTARHPICIWMLKPHNMAESKRHTRLQKLTGSDFEISEGDPDIRNWSVKDGSGNTLGRVVELIFDIQDRKAKYIVVNIEGSEGNETGRAVLVPVGLAEVHGTDDVLLMPGVDVSQLLLLPEFDEERFDTEHETGVRNVFGGLGAAALSGGTGHDFYDHDHFNENNLFKHRRFPLK